MRDFIACGPWEQGPSCGPFGPYGRFGCQERRYEPVHIQPPGPGFFDGRTGGCHDDSGPESGGRHRGGQGDSGAEGPRRQGPHRGCQGDSGAEGPKRQGPHRHCSGRRRRGCESSDEEETDRPGRRCGCRRHHRGPFGPGGSFSHAGPFGHSGLFRHRGPFGPFRGRFGPDHFVRHGCFGHGPSFGPFGEHFGHHGGQWGAFRPDGCDFGRENCRCNQNEGCMNRGKGCCSKNKDHNKDAETEGAGKMRNKQCGPQNKDQSGTVLVQRIVVETPRSYSV